MDKAVPELFRATQLASYDTYYLIRYAVACLATDQFIKAIDALRSALRMDPRNRCYQVLLADAYTEAGLEQEAAQMLVKAGELDSYEMEFVGRRRLELNRAEHDAGGRAARKGPSDAGRTDSGRAAR